MNNDKKNQGCLLFVAVFGVVLTFIGAILGIIADML